MKKVRLWNFLKIAWLRWLWWGYLSWSCEVKFSPKGLPSSLLNGINRTYTEHELHILRNKIWCILVLISNLTQGFEHLVVITGIQCFVYNVSNLNIPIIFDFVGGVSLLILTGIEWIVVLSMVMWTSHFTILWYSYGFISTDHINPMHSDGHFLTLDCLHGIRVGIKWQRVRAMIDALRLV